MSTSTSIDSGAAALLAAAPRRPASRLLPLLWACVLAALATVLLHAVSLRSSGAADGALLVPAQVSRIADASLVPPAGAQRAPATLPFYEPAPSAAAPARPLWLVARFELQRPADTTWALAFGHRTAVLVYLDGRLLANSVPLTEADLPPRNLQIGDRRLSANVPADWLGAGPHEIAIRVGAAGPSGVSVSALTFGPAQAVDAADRGRRLWLALRVLTALSAVVIGTLLLFVWLVDRHEKPYLWAALQLLLLALLLAPYLVSEPPLPSPWWRMLLDAADIVAKGLAPVVIAAWTGPLAARAQRPAFVYIALALPIDLLAAYHRVPWADFSHPWPWWALASRLAILGFALVVALRALSARPGRWRFGTAVLAGLALAIWVDVSLFAIVLPGRLAVVDLNVIAYAGWTLWVGVLLHRRLVRERRREQRMRDALAEQLAARTTELKAQFSALQQSESARLAVVERERLLQEMHDGLGAQLTNAKMLASSGRISTTQMVDALDACIRELRLTVDALSVTDGDLGLLLGALRQRLEPGLRAAGLGFDWRVEDAPMVPSLRGTGARELARIVQEALANVLHHASASRVTVSSRLANGGDSIVIGIADDGRGLPKDLTPGRGLRNMRSRAARIGATIQWRKPAASGRGTELLIELPMQNPGSR